MPDFKIDPVNYYIEEVDPNGDCLRLFLPWQNTHNNTITNSLAPIPSLIFREWCVIRGIPSSKATTLTREQLEKCFCIENYFKVVKGDKISTNPGNLPSMPQRNTRRPWKSVNSAQDFLEEDGSNPFATPEIPNPIPNSNFRPASPRPNMPTLTRDLIQEFLKTMSPAIDEKVNGLRGNLDNEIQNLLDKSRRDIADLHSAIERDIRHDFETGTLDLRLSPALEAKILGLVRKASEELAWDNRIQTLHSPTDSKVLIPNAQDASVSVSDPNLDPLILPYIPRLNPNHYFDPKAVKILRYVLKEGKNAYVYGETGCGKTSGIEQICAVLNRGISRINPHDGVTKEMFCGGMRLVGGETKFIEGALPRAMKLGLVLLIDEISFLPPNLTAILNPVLEKGGKLYIPETGEWIVPHPAFCVWATDNTGGKGDRSGQYTGTEVQNTATLDRFNCCFRMDYLPRDKEQEMLQKRFPNLVDDGQSNEHKPSLELTRILSLAHDIRSAFSRGELAITFSTRKLIEFFSQRETFSLSESLDNCLMSWLDEDDTTLVKTMIDRLGIKLGEEEDHPWESPAAAGSGVEFKEIIK